MKKELLFNGVVVQAEVDFVTERDIEKFPILYEHLEDGDIRKVTISEIVLHSADTDVITDLELLKKDIEDLILNLKKINGNE